MNRSRLFGALCALLFALRCDVAEWPREAHAVETVRIGVSGPFTGANSPIGISMREGIRIAAAQINADGGVLGRPIELVERDDESRNEVGARVAEQLIERHRVVAALGSVDPGVALASHRHYQLARIPVITAAATGTLVTSQFRAPEFADNFVFRVAASDRVQAAKIVDEAVINRGLRRVAIFHDATNYGQRGRADLEQALARHAIAPVLVERVQPDQNDLGGRLGRARAAGAEVVPAYGIGAEPGQPARAVAASGPHARLTGTSTPRR